MLRKNILSENFQWMLGLSIVLGFLFPSQLLFLSDYNNHFVAGIIFVSFFFRPFSKNPEKFPWRIIVKNIFLVKMLLPIFLFFIFYSFYREVSPSVLLLASLPAAGVSPLIIMFLGGELRLALQILLIESVLSCGTIPLLFYFLPIDGWEISPYLMGSFIFLLLVIPLFISEMLRKIISEKTIFYFSSLGKELSVFLIFVLLVGISAKVSPLMMEKVELTIYYIFINLFLTFLLPGFSILLSQPSSREESITLGIKNMYINIGLGLGIASMYLNQENLLFILSFVFPANLLTKQVAMVSEKVGKLVQFRRNR